MAAVLSISSVGLQSSAASSHLCVNENKNTKKKKKRRKNHLSPGVAESVEAHVTGAHASHLVPRCSLQSGCYQTGFCLIQTETASEEAEKSLVCVDLLLLPPVRVSFCSSGLDFVRW